MRKIAALLSIIILFAVAVPFSSLKIVSANPAPIQTWSPPEISILSPIENGTYNSNVPLSLKITLFVQGYYLEQLMNLSYNLDGKPDIALTSYSFVGPDYSDRATLFVSERLSGLTDGQHTLTVHGITKWYHSFSSTVNFT